MAQLERFISLPEDVQVEVFSFLSVKQTPTLLLLNKSLHGQLMHSERFWEYKCKQIGRILSSKSMGVINEIPPNSDSFTFIGILKSLLMEKEERIKKIEEKLEKLEDQRINTIKQQHLVSLQFYKTKGIEQWNELTGNRWEEQKEEIRLKIKKWQARLENIRTFQY